jgi:galactose-1-phosphate uridylyltransferase
MFTIREIPVGTGTLQERKERLTGLRCTISPERVKRHINQAAAIHSDSSGCPFCPENILKVTPVFPDKKRIIRGESVTFPNLFPFAQWHTVTVITRNHIVPEFTERQIADALSAQTEALIKTDGYASINWNYLPSAGASLVHPHMQALSGRRPSFLPERYILAGRRYYSQHGKTYWTDLRGLEQDSDRFLFGDEIFWHAHAVPVGEREVRAILPISHIDELESYAKRLARDILSVISFYRTLGTYAFNMSVFFDKRGMKRGFSSFCSFISRINPNPNSTSDSAFMERLHLQPVILTLPEDLGPCYRGKAQ